MRPPNDLPPTHNGSPEPARDIHASNADRTVATELFILQNSYTIAQRVNQRLEDEGIEFVLAQFVDIHGAAKVKMVPATALGVVTTVLLALKLQTQSLVRNITREDVYATLKFAVITAIILPLLPREGFGPPPFDVLVPFNVWLMVVFIALYLVNSRKILPTISAVIENRRERIASDLRAAAVIRNVICHGSWGMPDDAGRSLPLFVNKRIEKFETPIDRTRPRDRSSTRSSPRRRRSR